MNPDLMIKKMLGSYKEDVSQIQKLREVLQQTALLGLARHQFFEHAAFYGGTALRILYGLDRFSEDLDFSLIKPNPQFDFNPYLEAMHQELLSMGFDLHVTRQDKNESTGIRSAFLKANTFSLLLVIQERSTIKGIHPEQKIQIKLEIDTDPPFSYLPPERKLVVNPIPFYVVTYALPDLFAGKMHAILCRGWQKRIKGRDWYDLIWYIQKNVPLHLPYLRERMEQTKHIPKAAVFKEKEFFELLHQKIDSIDWELAKSDVELFISDKRRLDLWSSALFHDMVSHIRCIDS